MLCFESHSRGSSLSQNPSSCSHHLTVPWVKEAGKTKESFGFHSLSNATAQFSVGEWWKGRGEWFSHPTEQMSGFVCSLDNGRDTWLLMKEIISCFELRGFQNHDRQQTHDIAWDWPSFSNYSLVRFFLFLKENYYFILSEWLQEWGLQGKYQISPTYQQWDPDPFHCSKSLRTGTGVTLTLICETMWLFGFTRVTKPQFTFPWLFISFLNLQLPTANLEIVACWDISQKYHPF